MTVMYHIGLLGSLYAGYNFLHGKELCLSKGFCSSVENWRWSSSSTVGFNSKAGAGVSLLITMLFFGAILWDRRSSKQALSSQRSVGIQKEDPDVLTKQEFKEYTADLHGVIKKNFSALQKGNDEMIAKVVASTIVGSKLATKGFVNKRIKKLVSVK